MNQITHCDWLPERARWSCPLGISRLVPQDQRSFFGVLSHEYNKSRLVNNPYLQLAGGHHITHGENCFINVTLFGKTGLNENSVVMHFQCILNALIMHYNALIMVLNAFVMLFSPL